LHGVGVARVERGVDTAPIERDYRQFGLACLLDYCVEPGAGCSYAWYRIILTGSLAMLARREFVSCALCAAGGFVATGVAAQTNAPTAGIVRNILRQIDGPMDGYVTVLAIAEVQPGAIVARHIHPGIESAYFMTGGGILSVKGEPDRQIAVGDSFQVAAYTPHSLRNGDSVTRVAATYVVEKGKPLASPAPE
jgi:quercetin dioxygenase-like cupin family protein